MSSSSNERLDSDNTDEEYDDEAALINERQANTYGSVNDNSYQEMTEKEGSFMLPIDDT